MKNLLSNNAKYIYIIGTVLISGCGGGNQQNPVAECTAPKNCFSIQPTQDKTCLLPNDANTAIRNKIKLTVHSWGKPDKDLQLGIVREKWSLNGTKLSETRDALAPYKRGSTTDLGCSHTLEGGNLIELHYNTYCASFTGDACTASNSDLKISTSFPTTCPFTVDEPSLGNALRKTSTLITSNSNYPIDSATISSYFTNLPITCNREKISLDPKLADVIWNASNQTCEIISNEKIQGQSATISVKIPTILKVERHTTPTDVTLSFFDDYAPTIRSDDNTNISKLIGGTVSGLRLQKYSSYIYIKRTDNSTTCITLTH